MPYNRKPILSDSMKYLRTLISKVPVSESLGKGWSFYSVHWNTRSEMHFKESEKVALNSRSKVRYGLLNSYSLWSISQRTIFSIPFGAQTMRDYDSPSYFFPKQTRAIKLDFYNSFLLPRLFSQLELRSKCVREKPEFKNKRETQFTFIHFAPFPF